MAANPEDVIAARSDPLPRRAPVALAAAVTTSWAALVSLTPVLALVALAAFSGGEGPGPAALLRIGLAGWLLAHGVPLDTDLGPIGLAPLAISVLAGWRVLRAGVHTARAIGARRRRSVWLAVLAAFGVGVVYGLLGAGAAELAAAPGLRVPVLRAGVTLGAFGLLAALAGALRESGGYATLARRTPPVLRDAVRVGVVATLLVLGAGAAAAGTAVAFAGGEASGMLAQYRTGVLGQAGLTLLCLVYAPVFAVWAASYLVGPGFSVGVGTTVSAARVSLHDLPAVPALAGLPTGPVPGWGALLLGVPLAAGMAAGFLLARRRLRAIERGIERGDAPVRASRLLPGLLGAAVLAGPVAGGLLGLAALAASGPLGSGRLSVLGPAAGLTAAVGAGLVAAGAAVAVVATTGLIGVRRQGR